jgi:hypothetical protein
MTDPIVMPYSLGDMTIWPGDFSGFAAAKIVTRIRLLSDGSTPGSEAIQSGSVPRREATMSLPWVEDTDYGTLRDAYEAVSSLSCVTPLETLDVYIEAFAPTSIGPGLWSVNLTLVAL